MCFQAFKDPYSLLAYPWIYLLSLWLSILLLLLLILLFYINQDLHFDWEKKEHVFFLQ